MMKKKSIEERPPKQKSKGQYIMSNNFVPSAAVRRQEKHKRQQVWHIRGKGELLL